MDGQEALHEVCRRFLYTYGPARPASSAWFWRERSSCPRTCALRLARRRAGGDRGRRATRLRPCGGHGHYRAAPSLRLLPEYDVYIMGFREREHLVPEPVKAQVAAHGKGRYEGPSGHAVPRDRRRLRGHLEAEEVREEDRADGRARPQADDDGARATGGRGGASRCVPRLASRCSASPSNRLLLGIAAAGVLWTRWRRRSPSPSPSSHRRSTTSD